jgi:ABC-2 type transport system ATP-binding protein
MQRLKEATDAPLRTLGLTKVFKTKIAVQFLGGARENTAVDHLNITTPKNAIYGFLGPNGAGKTTTIRMIVGLIKPTSGTASICGHTIHDDLRGAQRCIGYMPDAVRLPSMKAVALLEILGEYAGLKRAQARRNALEMLSWAGLDDQGTLNTKVSRWSAGMQRKLLFIQAMLHKPDVLILDEPTANLDPVARRSLIDLLKRAAQGDSDKSWHPTIMISSHDLPEVQEVSTVIGFLSHGTLIAEGTQEALRKAITEATDGGATTFTVTGNGLDKIVEDVKDRLGSVSGVSDTKFTVTTKHSNTLFKELAIIGEKHPDVSITNLVQEEDSLESIFIKLEKMTKTKNTQRSMRDK